MNESTVNENGQDDASDGHGVEADSKAPKDSEKQGRFMKVFKGLFKDQQCAPHIEYGKTVSEMPNKRIKEMDIQVLSAFAAPENSLEHVHRRVNVPKANLEVKADRTPIAGVHNWNKRVDKAYGLLTSLYDNVKETGKKVGDPIADCLAVISRPNNGILVIADGVSWGEKSRLAAWCAVYGCVTHLSLHLHQALTTKDVFRVMLDSFQTAHRYIVKEDATMSTLCACVVVELQERNKWAICMVNVGDSLGFVYDKSFGVSEITVGSHSIDVHRDMRFSGGALGPVDGFNPDLSNLTCSFAIVNEQSVVFLASDGICDNFDPQVGHFSVRKPPVSPQPKKSNSLLYRRASNFLESIGTRQNLAVEKSRKRSVSFGGDSDDKNTSKDTTDERDTTDQNTLTADDNPTFNISTPKYTPEERHKGMQEKFREVIEEGDMEVVAEFTARDVCARCLNFAVRNTEEKRKLHEKEGLNPQEMSKLSGKERRILERELKEKLDATRGKLDHASIVAFVVGFEEEKPFALYRDGTGDMQEELPSSGSPKRRPGSGSPSSMRLKVPSTLEEEDTSTPPDGDIELLDMSPKISEREISNLAFCALK